MTRRQYVSLITIIALLAFADSGAAIPQPATAQSRRQIEVVWTTEGPAENPFRLVDGMAEGPDGAVYIVDGQAHSVYRFDPQTGEFTWLDRRGQGPGELDVPYLVTFTRDGELAVYDVGRRMVLLYSLDLEPQRQFVLQPYVFNPKGFAYLSDGSFIISGRDPGRSSTRTEFFGVHRFDGNSGNRIGQYVRLPDPGPKYRMSLGYISGGPVFGLEEGGFLYSNSAPHRIVHVDESFNEHEIASDFSVVEPILETFATSYYDSARGVNATRFDWYHDQPRGIFRLADGRVLNIITRQHSRASTWELWSMAGELLERFDVDEPWRPYGITKDEEILVSYLDAVSGECMVAALLWK